MKLLCALLCLCFHLAAADRFPCEPTMVSHSSIAFRNRHLNPEAPSSRNLRAWTLFLRQTTDCGRPITSIIPWEDRYRVEHICESSGAKQESENFCISATMFDILVVESEVGTCVVSRIYEASKHLIVACDLVDGDICLPTELKENVDNLVPSNFTRVCNKFNRYNVDMTDHSSELRAVTPLSVLLILLPLTLHYILH